MKQSFGSDDLKASVFGLQERLVGAMEQVDASSIRGFITCYGFLCDFFGVQLNEEVLWVSV